MLLLQRQSRANMKCKKIFSSFYFFRPFISINVWYVQQYNKRWWDSELFLLCSFSDAVVVVAVVAVAAVALDAAARPQAVSDISRRARHCSSVSGGGT